MEAVEVVQEILSENAFRWNHSQTFCCGRYWSW